MKTLEPIACFTIFKGNYFGHGGEKRTKQIETLISGEFNYQRIHCPFLYNKIDKISMANNIKRSPYIPQVLSVKSNRKNASLKSLLKESNRFFKQEKFLMESEPLFGSSSAVIWENTFPDFYHMISLLKQRYSKKIIACPHNLESLIPLQRLNWFGKTKIEFLEQELEVLRLCDEVFTISEEEEWLLNLFGITAKYLPYYPLGDLFESLLTIRKHRVANEQQPFFLILGSASNPPTRVGMINLLQWLQKIVSQKKINYRFKITGYGTEQFRNDFHSDKIEVLGYTEEPVLNDLMRNCKAMIVNQDYSTGALTKIPEMLVAGIPVVVNNAGARTFRRTEGVFVFQSESGLAQLLLEDLGVPPLPSKPTEYMDRFTTSIRNGNG